MTISVRCQCGKAFAARDELAGKRVKCPACGGVLQIPTPPAPALAPLDDDPLGLGGVDLSAAVLVSRPAPAGSTRPRVSKMPKPYKRPTKVHPLRIYLPGTLAFAILCSLIGLVVGGPKGLLLGFGALFLPLLPLVFVAQGNPAEKLSGDAGFAVGCAYGPVVLLLIPIYYFFLAEYLAFLWVFALCARPFGFVPKSYRFSSFL